jgi:glycosyltransferase AglI
MRKYQKNELTISVIIPVYNDPIGLKDTLTSIVNQDFYKRNYEVIIADNGSHDETLGIAKEYIEKYPGLVKLVIEDKIRSSYAARNKGIKASSGGIIAFIDADMTVNKEWLKSIVESFKNNNTDYIGYKVEITMSDKTIPGLYNKITGFPVETYIKNNHFAPTCCLLVKKKIFKEIGLFDSRLISSGDLEFGNRVFKNGYLQHFDTNIKAKHPARITIRQLLNKHFRIGRGAQQISYLYPDDFRELKRNMFNCKYYLPSKPWTFFKKFKKYEIWHELNFFKKLQIYFVGWLVKLALHIGYIYEKIIVNKR